jgi:hypothetical protein
MMDYLMSILVITSPWLFGFAAGGIETWTPVVLGLGSLTYSLFTKYELGVSRSIPMRTHLILDMISGATLATAPWIFGFSDHVFVPHFILGLVELSAALMTDPVERHTSVHRLRQNQRS